MYPGVKSVKPLADYRLLLVFDGGERRIFDVTPWLTKGAFRELRDESVFRTARVSFDTVEWDNGTDLCPELLYSESVRIASGAAVRPLGGTARAVAEGRTPYRIAPKPGACGSGAGAKLERKPLAEKPKRRARRAIRRNAS